MDINEVVLPKRNRCSCGGYGELHEWGVIGVKGSKSFMTCSHCDKMTKVHNSVAKTIEEWNEIAEDVGNLCS